MNIIVLHDKYSNEPIVVRISAIQMVRKEVSDTEEYSSVMINAFCIDVKETIGEVMMKIKKSEEKTENE